MTSAEICPRCNSFEEELNRVDPQREQFLLEKIKRFSQKIKPGDKALTACHPDADGYISGAFLKAFVNRFFKGKVRTEFCTDELKTQEFYDKAKDFKHVITGDLWIDEAEEKQQGLRALLKQGVNIAVFDHHDKPFPDFAPQRIEEMLASGLEYTPTIPESSQQDLDPRTKGSITYVSPKRLGFHNPDPNKFTGALIIYKMLGQLVDLSDLEFLLPISAKGDCDAGKKYWPKLLEKYAGHKKETDEIAEIAGSLNFGKNLTLPAAERLMTWFASMNGQRNSYKEIKQDGKLSDLRKLRAHTRGRVEAILREGTRIAGRFFHYHVTAEDEQAARKGLDGDLNHELVLDTGLSEALCERIGNKITVIVTQVRKGIPEGFHVCFKDERGDREHDMTVLAKLFRGGGHENASGAEREVRSGWAIESVVAEFRSELKKIAESFNIKMETQELSRVDQERLEFYIGQLGEFLEKIKPGDRVLVACHGDADGMTGGAIAEYFLEENKEGVQIGTCHHVLDTPEFYETAKDYDHVIVVDLWIDSRVGHQENLIKLSEEGKNIIILDHHDERYDPSKIQFDGPHDHEIPETISKRILYITPNRLNSPLGHHLTGALVAYLMLAPFSKSRLERMKKFLAISVSGDYARDQWPKLLKEIGSMELADTLGHALNGGHAIDGVTNIVKAMKRAETIEELSKSEEVKVLMDILGWVREKIEQVDASAPFLIHSHLEPEDFENKVFKHQIVRKPPRITNIVADELRQCFRDRIVLITQAQKDGLKMSFRSSSDDTKFDTRRLAGRFGGGGHRPASSATIPTSEMSTEEALRAVEKLVREENAKFLRQLA